ncbi:MAG: DNA-binding response regulator [Nitrospiraceae bacterium]|nr:DNA-binding response regulator [Nitrospiraceae bacterium]
MALLVASETGLPEIAGPLKKDGHRIVTCTLKELLSAAGQAVETVLLDCGLNAEKGLRLLRTLKARRPEIPVIFFTGISSEAIIANAFRSGARDFFKKPVNLYELKEALCNLPRDNILPVSARQGMEVAGREAGGCAGLPPNLLRAVRHMERNFSGDIRLPVLAREAGLSKYHLCRAFKRHTGFTPMRYLARLRVERAKALLNHDSLSVSTVAVEVGFNDLGGFIKQFKRLTGFTPGEFKKGKGRESLRLF